MRPPKKWVGGGGQWARLRAHIASQAMRGPTSGPFQYSPTPKSLSWDLDRSDSATPFVKCCDHRGSLRLQTCGVPDWKTSDSSGVNGTCPRASTGSLLSVILPAGGPHGGQSIEERGQPARCSFVQEHGHCAGHGAKTALRELAFWWARGQSRKVCDAIPCVCT